MLFGVSNSAFVLGFGATYIVLVIDILAGTLTLDGLENLDDLPFSLYGKTTWSESISRTSFEG